jgi:hypothetical protein
MANAAVETAGESWSYESRGTVGVWRVHDVRTLFDRELTGAERHFATTAGDRSTTGAVVAFDCSGYIDDEMQAHIGAEWSRLGRAVDVNRVAYVDDGIRSWTAKLNVSVPDAEVGVFESVPAAVAWAGGDDGGR